MGRVERMAQQINLAVVAGDGIGTEVVEQGLLALDAALADTGTTVSTTAFDLGARRWHATGETLTDEDLAAIRTHDAILLGAIGDPTVPSGVLERGFRQVYRRTNTNQLGNYAAKLAPVG